MKNIIVWILRWGLCCEDSPAFADRLPWLMRSWSRAQGDTPSLPGLLTSVRACVRGGISVTSNNKNVTLAVFQLYLTITFQRTTSKRFVGVSSKKEQVHKALKSLKTKPSFLMEDYETRMRKAEQSNQSARHGTVPEHEEITWHEDAALLNYKSMDC